MNNQSLIIPALEGIQLDGTGFALYDVNFRTNDQVRFDLQFKTQFRDGLLLLLHNFSTDENLTVEMVNGQVNVRLTTQRAIISLQSGIRGHKITDNNWHCLNVEINRNKISMKIDMNSFTKIDPKLFGNLAIEGSLFIAGFPDHVNPSHTANGFRYGFLLFGETHVIQL
ncbi:hypothetical protein ACOME3_005904 [Neoechinorhynchus agilis]